MGKFSKHPWGLPVSGITIDRRSYKATLSINILTASGP